MIVGIRGNECRLFSVLMCQGNLLIPLKGVQKVILRCPYMASTNWLIFNIGNGSFGQVQFKSVKSTHTRHFLLFFFTTTVLANHSGKKISLITPASFSLYISDLTASTCSLAALHGFYFVGGNEGSTLCLWTMNSGSTLGTSYGLHANTSTLCMRNNNISTLS